jgi:hypothetical protein
MRVFHALTIVLTKDGGAFHCFPKVIGGDGTLIGVVQVGARIRGGGRCIVEVHISIALTVVLVVAIMIIIMMIMMIIMMINIMIIMIIIMIMIIIIIIDVVFMFMFIMCIKKSFIVLPVAQIQEAQGSLDGALCLPLHRRHTR